MRRARAAVLLSILSIGAATAAPRSARAQAAPAEGSPSSNEAAAEALFTEARKLIEGGNVEEGCKKLEASQKLDPGTGTLIHLADCYEKLGRTATSWARFREAAARAAREGRADWEGVAKTRASELEPKLAKLRIEAAPGIAVRRDGDEIPAAALGTALPIDPGEHAIVASARGKKPWIGRVTAVAASTVDLRVPPLEDDPETAAGPPPDAERTTGSSLRTIGYVAGAVGLVGITVGAITGLSAISSNNRSKETCPASGVCPDDAARADNDSARSSATISTIGFVAGGILLAGGLALVIAAPSSTSGRAPASAALRASPNALWLEGTW